nr:MAG TPA: hypothetical protein [Caudoviricetes sp.]
MTEVRVLGNFLPSQAVTSFQRNFTTDHISEGRSSPLTVRFARENFHYFH